MLSLPIPEVPGLNPVIGKNLYWTFTVNSIEKAKIKRKRPGMAQFKKIGNARRRFTFFHSSFCPFFFWNPFASSLPRKWEPEKIFWQMAIFCQPFHTSSCRHYCYCCCCCCRLPIFIQNYFNHMVSEWGVGQDVVVRFARINVIFLIWVKTIFELIRALFRFRN